MSFSSAPEAVRFILAGNARVTLVSAKTGTRFTYRVVRPEAEGPFFVSLLNGSDNERDYVFLGTIFVNANTPAVFRHGTRSRIGPDAPSSRALAWAWNQYLSHGLIPPACEIHHEGRCGKCGRALTVPESIASGLGPICGAGGSD